jgi:hypothetical protein
LSFAHDVFLSYARTPDAVVAREVERVLESFHETVRRGGALGVDVLAPLSVCVDGSDFSLPAPDERGAFDDAGEEVFDVIVRHLSMCRELLVLCSSGTARSPWIDREVRWFLERRGPGFIRVAVTEGTTASTAARNWLPKALLGLRFQKRIFYDLRGHDPRRARDWEKVPEFAREVVRLAADLHGRPPGKLYPAWLASELERARGQSLSLLGAARFETFTGDPGRALLVAFEAHGLHPSAETEQALHDAYRVTVLHRENRVDTAQMTGSGPAYGAARWRQGAVYSKPSHDGRYLVMVTERGRDGANPPGDVFVINNETMRVVKLVPPPGEDRRRVESVAFDRRSRHVFVTRQFYLHVYDLDGRLVGRYGVQRHTKSPVHIVAGYLGRFVFVGESKGGLWLVDPIDSDRQSRQIFREWHRDETLAVDIAPNGRLAALLTRSGNALLVALDGEGEPEMDEVPGGPFGFAGFPFESSEVIAVATRGGVVKTFATNGALVEPLAESPVLGAPLDWISGAIDGRSMLAIGESSSLFVLDAARGELLQTLNYADDIG